MVVSLFGITNSTKDIVTLVNVKDRTKIKLFNAENPETEGEDKVSYVITFQNFNREDTFYCPAIIPYSVKVKKGAENRDLVICNNCLWSVSLIKGSKVFDRCPVCKGEKIEVIPVEDYENYKLSISRKRGLSMEFTGNV